MGYQLTKDPGVVRVTDGAYIPKDPLNGDWRDYQAWVAAGGVATPLPALTKSDLATYAKAKQQLVMMAGTLINGVWVDTSVQGLVLLAGAVQLAQQQPNTNINWISSAGSVSLTPAQVIGLGVAVGNRTQATFTTLGNVIGGITATSPTITTPAQIDAAAWPT